MPQRGARDFNAPSFGIYLDAFEPQSVAAISGGRYPYRSLRRIWVSRISD